MSVNSSGRGIHFILNLKTTQQTDGEDHYTWIYTRSAPERSIDFGLLGPHVRVISRRQRSVLSRKGLVEPKANDGYGTFTMKMLCKVAPGTSESPPSQGCLANPGLNLRITERKFG